MPRPLRVLIVEDSEDDALLLVRVLRRGGYELLAERVDTDPDFRAALARQAWDVVVADYSLPNFGGLIALESMHQGGYDLPFILVSGTIGEELAVEAMKAGAHDYVMKDNLVRLVPAIERELQEGEIRRARRRAEEALRASEERFRRMAESILDGLTIVEGSRVVYVNDRMCAISGYSREELMQMKGPEFATPEEMPRLQRILDESLQLQVYPAQLEFWIVRPDGTRRCVFNRYTTQPGSMDFGDRYIVTTDITERKQAEREIAERRLYLERVLTAAPDAIITLDAEHQVVEWNLGAQRLFGYTRRQAIGERLERLIGHDEVLDEASPGQDLSPMEVVRYRQNGSSVDVIASGSPIVVDGKLIGAVAVYTDISKRLRAERLLQALNEVALAVERALTIEDIFGTAGREFQKLGFRCTILGLDENETKLRPLYSSYEPQAVEVLEILLGAQAGDFSIAIDTVNALQQVVRRRQSVFTDGRALGEQMLPRLALEASSRLMEVIQVSRFISAPLIVDDEVIGVLSVQSDDLSKEDVPAITAFAHQMAAAWRKAQLLQDLEKSLEQLKQTQAQFLQAQKMEAVGRFAGGVAHDFNNALTIIHLSTQILKRQVHADDPVREYVDQIEAAGQRAATLTKQLLSFSRREIVEPRVVDLSRAIANLSEMLQRLIGEDIELVLSLAGGLWPVWIDPAQLDQVILNLVVNARDAMPRGGSLTIGSENVVLAKDGPGAQAGLPAGDYVLLQVTDTGVGMTDEVKAHLFEPFFTTKEAGKGTGLGLATVYGIVTQNGGRTSVISEVGQGSSFQVWLPRTDKTESPRHARAVPTSTSGGSETILVVEDDPAVRRMARQILASCGYHILSAHGGPQALEISRSHLGSIHLLLTDVVLPHMNGRELAETLKQERPDIRVVYMSGYSDDAIAQHGVLREGIFFVPKPFTMEILAQKVRIALDSPP